MPRGKSQNVVLDVPQEELKAKLKELKSGDRTVSAIEFNGPQVKVLTSLADEILNAGGRGGGKSTAAIHWMVGGNPHLPKYRKKTDGTLEKILFNWSYIYHPKFLGVVLRKNQVDLVEFREQAAQVWCNKESDPKYRLKLADNRFSNECGAQIVLGHLDDPTSWTKYQGWNVIRLYIEEGGLIPDAASFNNLRGSLRSVWRELRPQMLITANPGGPGQSFLYDRYIEPKDKSGKLLLNEKGEPYKPEDVITETVDNPFTGKKVKVTRVWIPSGPQDNPHLSDSYIAQLATIDDERTRRAWLYGDWKAFRGVYFDNFHPDTHTVPESAAAAIRPWWRRFIAVDWGFRHDAAATWAARNPDTGQVIVYDHFATSGMEVEEFFAEVARRTIPDLRAYPNRIIKLYLSHDAYQQRTGEITIADIAKKGMARIIGREAIHIPELVARRAKDDAERMGQEFSDEAYQELRQRQRAGINIVRAPKITLSATQYLRSMFRTKPLVDVGGMDMSNIHRVLMDRGPAEFEKVLETFKYKPEVLPKLLIVNTHNNNLLINSIPKAVHESDERGKDVERMSDKHFTGKDSLDSLIYLVNGCRDESNEEPPEEKLGRKIDLAKQRGAGITELMIINDEFRASQPKSTVSVSFPRTRRAKMAIQSKVS